MQQLNEASERSDAGVTFSDVVREAKRLRYFLLSLILIAVAASAALFGFRISSDGPVTFFIELISIKNKAYPNGANFSPNDILSAEVLEVIKNKFDVSDYQKLRESISVDYGSPAAEGVRRQYTEQLERKNLTQPEIAAINNSFAQELAGINEKGLRITVDPRHLGVSETIAKEIAVEIPRQWSQFSIKKYKIFEDPFLSSVDIPPQAPKFNDATDVLLAYRMITQMREGNSRLLNDNRVVAVKTESGKSAADLGSEMDRYLSVFFMPIFIYYNKKDELAFANYLDELQLKISEIDARIAGVDSIVDALRQERRQDLMSSKTFDGQKGPDMVQLGESGIKNTVDLAERASLSSYLKETLENRRLLVFERSSTQKELDRLTKYSASDRSISDHFKNTSEVMMSEIRNEYVQLLDKSREKLESGQKSLYTPVGLPISPDLLSKAMILQIIGIFGIAFAAMVTLVTIKLLLI